MYKNVLQSIEGVGLYPIISLLLFFLFFAAVIIWFFRADKAYLKKMAQLPLDSSDHLSSDMNSQPGE
jgi:cbb3-type cytochrome oxidase subunit 3